MSDKDKVSGKSLYVEMRNTSGTYQMLITPDGVGENGRAVPPMVYRRQISKMTPRRAWKVYSLAALPLNAFGGYDQVTKELATIGAGQRMNHVESIFKQLNSYGYKVYKQPLVVEVSQADLEEIRYSKTPYKILGRITRVRKTLGFGELIAE
jgi:hypothetical protein